MAVSLPTSTAIVPAASFTPALDDIKRSARDVAGDLDKGRVGVPLCYSGKSVLRVDRLQCSPSRGGCTATPKGGCTATSKQHVVPKTMTIMFPSLSR